MWLKTKEFLRQHEPKIIIVIGFILVAVLSFEAGIMKGKNMQQNPVLVKAPENQTVCGASSSQSPEAQNSPVTATNAIGSATIPIATLAPNCAFVGSKNSN